MTHLLAGYHPQWFTISCHVIVPALGVCERDIEFEPEFEEITNLNTFVYHQDALCRKLRLRVGDNCYLIFNFIRPVAEYSIARTKCHYENSEQCDVNRN